MMKSYQAGISGMRWVVSPRDDVSPVLQYALRPINGGAADWFDVPTEVAADHPAEPVAGHVAEGLPADDRIDALWREATTGKHGSTTAEFVRWFYSAAIAADRAGREQAPESILVKLRYIKRVLESMHPTPKDRADAAWACREMIESEWKAGREQGDGEMLDARRYRFMRDNDSALWRPFGLRHGGDASKADAAIDAAMKAEAAE